MMELECWSVPGTGAEVDAVRARNSSPVPLPDSSTMIRVVERTPLTTTSHEPSLSWRFSWIVSPFSVAEVRGSMRLN